MIALQRALCVRRPGGPPGRPHGGLRIIRTHARTHAPLADASHTHDTQQQQRQGSASCGVRVGSA
eukprot:scaffold19433_cov112-Isochrysis_galbana.AAC.2